MTDKRMFIITPTNREHIINELRALPVGHVIRTSPPTRTLEANAAMWATLTDISKQVVWHGRKLDPESWKHIFSSSLKRQDVVPNLDGNGFVVLGLSTSKMTKAEMSELLELIHAFAAQQGVNLQQPE